MVIDLTIRNELLCFLLEIILSEYLLRTTFFRDPHRGDLFDSSRMFVQRDWKHRYIFMLHNHESNYTAIMLRIQQAVISEVE